MTDTPQNLYSRLALARAEFQQIGDFKKVSSAGLRFAYLPVESAKPIVEMASSKYGISILPMTYEVVEKGERVVGQNGGKWWYESADIIFRIASPEDYVDLTIRAEAQDNSDKLINKVYTGAYKNLIKILFGFSESAKDDSKFSDAREQDNDFNQQTATPKVIDSDKKSKLIREITTMMTGKQDVTTAVFDQLKMFGKKNLGECDPKQLQSIIDIATSVMLGGL